MKPGFFGTVAALALAMTVARFAGASAHALEGPSFAERLDDGIVGALNHVLQTQTDCSSELPAGGYICNRDRPSELRLQGGWDSVIEPAFKLMGIAVKSPVNFVDSNMFTTAAVLYPLWMIDATDTPLSVENSIRLAIGNIDVHRRGEGYSFWPVLGPASGDVDRIGPLNLYSILLGAQIDLARRIQQATGLAFMPRDVRWIGSAFTEENSKLKKDVLFSVTSDADDTSLAIASRYFYSQDRILERKSDPSKELSDLKSTISLVSSLNKYTDRPAHREQRGYDRSSPGCRAMVERNQGQAFSDMEFLEKCSFDDPRERWKYDAYKSEGSYSGAYLTWLYDERRELFADPELGVILTGQNSVDCVVVANSLLAVSLSGLKNHPDYREAYEDSCNALTNVILDSTNQLRKGISGKNNAGVEATWKYCGLFYPAHLTFPYKLSRAVRDGGACKDLSRTEDQRRFDLALSVLLREVAEERDGDHWKEKIDDTTQLPTSLALLTLLNLGHEVSTKAGITGEQLESMITGGLEYLLRKKTAEKSVNGLPNYRMEAGTFFGGGTLNEIALWKSSAFATAAFLEAAVKYRIGSHRTQHLASSDPERTKLRIADVLANGPKRLASFSASQHPIDDTGFKREFLGEPINAQEIPSGLPPLTPDRLAQPRKSRVSGQVEIGIGTGSGGDTLGIVGIQLDVGTIYTEGATRIAYYLVRSKTRVGLGIINSSSNTPDVELSAEFLGISTDAPEVRDNVGFLPLVLIKQRDLLKMEAHAIHAEAELPLLNLGKGARLDLELGGRLLGYAFRRAKNDDAHSFVPITLKMGLMIKKEGTGSLGISAESALEYMKREEARETQRKWHTPVTVKATATYDLTDNLSLYMEYSHTRDDVLYPQGENRLTGGLRGTFNKPRKKAKGKTEKRR